MLCPFHQHLIPQYYDRLPPLGTYDYNHLSCQGQLSSDLVGLLYLGWGEPVISNIWVMYYFIVQQTSQSLFTYRQDSKSSKRRSPSAQVLFRSLLYHAFHCSVHFNSVTQSCPTLCDPMDCSTPGFPVHHQLLEFTQTHVRLISDAIQPSHPPLSPSLPAFNLSQHQGLFR